MMSAKRNLSYTITAANDGCTESEECSKEEEVTTASDCCCQGPTTQHGSSGGDMEEIPLVPGVTKSVSEIVLADTRDFDVRNCCSGPECGADAANQQLQQLYGDDSSPTTTTAENLKKSFVFAVHDKYGDYKDGGHHHLHDHLSEDLGDIKFDVKLPKHSPVKVTVSGSIMLPKQVSMSGQEISCAGDPRAIQRMCRHVTDLDLMANHMTRWEEVFSIVQSCPRLTFLNVGKNFLGPDLPVDLEVMTLPDLSHLVLNNMVISWEVFGRLLARFPSLVEIHLSKNDFRHVDLSGFQQAAETGSEATSTSTSSSTGRTYPSLQRLFFVGNEVDDFVEICKLGRVFNRLDSLMLSETALTTFGDAGPECIQSSFPMLSTIGCNRTSLQSWSEIEKFRHFPKLTDIRISGIPFLENIDEATRRWHTVALLPNVAVLNGGKVTPTEREDAERAYIRLYMDDKSGEEKPPGRYFELEQIYGKLAPLAAVHMVPEDALKLTVKVENAEGEVTLTKTIEVDLSMSVRDLKKIVSLMTGCPASAFQLFYNDPKFCYGRDKMVNPDRKLHSYRMKDGDELIVWL